MKSWTTRKGQAHAGRRFDRAALVRLLSNVLYLGEVRHQGKVYAGEQRAILDRETWQQAQGLLRQRHCQERTEPLILVHAAGEQEDFRPLFLPGPPALVQWSGAVLRGLSQSNVRQNATVCIDRKSVV